MDFSGVTGGNRSYAGNRQLGDLPGNFHVCRRSEEKLVVFSAMQSFIKR